MKLTQTADVTCIEFRGVCSQSAGTNLRGKRTQSNRAHRRLTPRRGRSPSPNSMCSDRESPHQTITATASRSTPPLTTRRKAPSASIPHHARLRLHLHHLWRPQAQRQRQRRRRQKEEQEEQKLQRQSSTETQQHITRRRRSRRQQGPKQRACALNHTLSRRDAQRTTE